LRAGGKRARFNSDAQGGDRTAASDLEQGLEGSPVGCDGLPDDQRL